MQYNNLLISLYHLQYTIKKTKQFVMKIKDLNIFKIS